MSGHELPANMTPSSKPLASIQQLREQTWLVAASQWTLLFLGLVIALWLATRSREAPQISLLILLYVVAINFSIPLTGHITGVTVPTVIVSSLLVLGFNTSLIVLLGGFALAELTRPLWKPLWQNTPLQGDSWRQRVLRFLVHFVALFSAGQMFNLTGGVAPLPQSVLLSGNYFPIINLAIVYGIVYFTLTILLYQFWREGVLREKALFVLMIAFITQPFALFGAITFVDVGLPAFVIFCIGVGAFAVITWISWYRNFILNERMMQFATLNDIGVSLRETLDLDTVLKRTYEQVNGLVPAGRFAISLVENGTWSQPLLVHQGQILPTLLSYQPDDFTQWVAKNNRILDLDPQNMHYSTRHNLAPPQPKPDMWLGIPLTTAQQVIGVMVLQRFNPTQPFNSWSREVLLAIAGQVSAAIENARLYSRTDEALAQRVQQLQALLNSTYEGVLMVDTTGRIVLINPMASSLIGKPRHELIHQPLNPAGMATALGYTTEHLTQQLRQLEQREIDSTERVIFQTHLTNEQGISERRFIERSNAPVLGQQKQVLGWLMVFHDVTEAQERAEWRASATRMIVHDLRNPLSTLLSTIDLLDHELQTADSERGSNLVNSARRVSTDMLDLVDSLMDMTRLEAGQLVVDAEAMHLSRLVNEVVEHMRPLAQQKQVTLTCQLLSNALAVWADQEIIRRVCINLLDNALKFTPAGGKIIATIQHEPAQPNHEPGLRCCIEDTGLGIPEEHKAAIFERFVRVNTGGAQIRGSGLGLTFCKLAIEAHNGKIWVEDAPAGGSRFIFTLPGIPLFT